MSTLDACNLTHATIGTTDGTIDAYYDTLEERKVVHFRKFSKSRAHVETVTLTDFDAERNRWNTIARTECRALDTLKDVRDFERRLVADIEAQLIKSVEYSGYRSASYYKK